jgi:very-short-patch-repair endonuclease
MPDASDKAPQIRGESRIDVQIAALADRQHGVVAYRQLVALGLGRRAIEHRIAVGRLHRIHRGVYAVGRPSSTPRGHWMAGVLAFGPAAVCSHRTAAALWGLRKRNAWKIDITVPTWRRAREGLWLHCSQLDPTEITHSDGIPVTTVARTHLDLAAVIHRDQVARSVEESERRGLFDLRAVERVLARAGHRPGTVALRSVLADYQDPADTHSELEHRFAALLRRSRIPAPQINVIAEGFEVDFLWAESCLIVELDGRAYHDTSRAFERDRLRDAKLQCAGYRVLRITHRRLRDDLAGILEDVRLLLG